MIFLKMRMGFVRIFIFKIPLFFEVSENKIINQLKLFNVGKIYFWHVLC
jgi:hypothetical protein